LLYAQSEFSLEKFSKIYEIIVNESPYAIFISNRTTQEEALTQVVEKMDISGKYGISSINIHGIGRENVDKIIYILEQIKDSINLPPEIVQEGGVITVKICIKQRTEEGILPSSR